MRLAPVILSLALAAACGESSTHPENPLGPVGTTYYLTTYNGLGLPASFAPSLGQCGGQVVAGALIAVAASEATVSISTSSACSAGNPVTTTATQGVLSAAASGALVLTFAQQAYADTITLSGLTATVRDRGNTFEFTMARPID